MTGAAGINWGGGDIAVFLILIGPVILKNNKGSGYEAFGMIGNTVI